MRSNASARVAAITAAAALTAALAAACSTTRDAASDSAAARVPVPDSIVVHDSAVAIAAGDSAAVASLRSRLDAAATQLRAPTTRTPIAGTRLSVRRDASQRVTAAMIAPDHPDSPSDAQYLYVFDDYGMTAGVEKAWSDSSRSCPRPVRVKERWMLRDGQVIGFDRLVDGQPNDRAATPACPARTGGDVVLYTSWPMLSISAMAAPDAPQ